MAISKAIKVVSEPKEQRLRKFDFFGKLYKLDLILLTVGLLVWIFVGSFFSLTIVDNLKAMAKQKVLDKTSEELSQSSQPTETTIPGVGKVNISCVEKELTPETIQKLFADGGSSNLTSEEKTKLETCLVGSQSTPSASPTQ